MTDKVKEQAEKISDPEELLQEARKCIEKEDYASAIIFLEKAHKLAPKNHVILNTLGLAHGRSKHFEKAIECYEKALEIEPDYQKAIGNMGHVYDMMGKPKKAVSLYKKALETKPEDEELRFPDSIIPKVIELMEKAQAKLEE